MLSETVGGQLSDSDCLGFEIRPDAGGWVTHLALLEGLLRLVELVGLLLRLGLDRVERVRAPRLGVLRVMKK